MVDIKKVNKAYVVFFLFILLFTAIESFGLSHYDVTDENIYFYAGKLIAEGKVPYRDFFEAHPPMRYYLNAALIKVFGYNPAILKLIPLLSVIIASFFLFKILMEKFGDYEAVIGVALFLFSPLVLMESTYAMGTNLTTVFVMAGIYLLLKKKYLQSGILLGIAGITGLYSGVFVMGILIFLLLKRKYGALIRFLMGFSAIFVTVNLLFLLVAGSAYLNGVYLYHFKKPGTGMTFNLLAVFTENVIIFLSLVSLLVSKKKKITFFAILAGLYLIFLMLIRDWTHYYVLLFAMLAIMGGFGAGSIIRRFGHKRFFLSIILAAIGITGLIWVNYLVNVDFVDFESLEKIESHISPGATIFGDDQTATLIALHNGNHIVNDMFSTNDMGFSSGILDIDNVLSDVKTTGVDYIIVRPLYSIGKFKEMKQFVSDNCQIEAHYEDRFYADFLVYRCR